MYLPKPKLGLGLALSRYLSSSIDSSDGLAISLHTISEMSGVGIRLTELPYAKGLEEFASRNSSRPRSWRSTAGRSTRSSGRSRRDGIQEARSKASALGFRLHVIGETLPAEPGTVSLADGRKVRKDGWVHFKSGR